MSTATFTQLPRELRDMIWSAAAPVQYQQVSNRFCSFAGISFIRTLADRSAVSEIILLRKWLSLNL
jgi:hypothetical protein